MHSKEWQAVCGYITDVCESLNAAGGTMRELFDLVTEERSAAVYSWKENGRFLYMRREDLRRKAVAAARKLLDRVPKGHRMIGLHISDAMYWPVWYWAILMSGHVPLILDPGRELFSYRSLKDCQGAYCITRDRNYGWIIDPDSLKDSASGVDPAFFDGIWADETCFVCEDADGRLSAIIHTGESMRTQALRLRHLYRHDQPLLYPPGMGRMRLMLRAPLHDPFGFLCGMILYPLFAGEVYIAPQAESALFRDPAVTHMCLSAEDCERTRDAILREAEKLFPKLSARYAAWLDGRERINDYRVLSRFQAMSAKLGKRIFGRKARCILCAGEYPDTSTAAFFSRFGIFFAGGLCCGPLGLVAMELTGEPEVMSKGSVGELLEGVSGFDAGGGRLLLNCGGPVGRILSNGALRDPDMPFPLPVKARFNQHGRLCLEERAARESAAPAAADPETVDKLKEIYALVLGRPAGIIGENMDFFGDLGGDSLTYFLLLQHIEAAFGVRIPNDERSYFVTVRFAAETLSNDERKVATNDA